MADSIGMSIISSNPSAADLRGDRLVNQLSRQGTTDRAKIEKSAREFEGILLGQWLSSAQQSFASVPGQEDHNQDPGHSQFQSLGMQQLAQSIANKGGVGIAAMIIKSLSRKAEADQSLQQTKEGLPGTPGQAAATSAADPTSQAAASASRTAVTGKDPVEK